MASTATLESWLRGPRLKINRAKKHIDELNAETASFFARNPYRIVVEANTGGHSVEWPFSLIVRVQEEIPEEFSAIIGDAVHNLRSVFDLLVCAFVRANGGSDQGVQLQIARDANSLESALKKRHIDRASPQSVDFVRAFKPYRGKGGNEFLCKIHDLDVLDKHILIIAVGNIAQFNHALIGLIHGSSTIITTPGYPWAGLEDGTKLIDIRAEPNLKIGDEVPATFSIAFGKGQPLHRHEVVPTLLAFVNYVERVVESVAAT